MSYQKKKQKETNNTDKPMIRSSLLGPWGIGAMVPFPNDESLMIAGLDMWDYKDNSDSFLIKDERLIKRLGVKELRWPPDYRDKSADSKNHSLVIPAVRFPRWHYCPHCGTMKKATFYQPQPQCDQYQWKTGRNCTPNKYRRKLIPERFVVICPEGHIDDFPVAEWIHREKPYDKDSCRIRRNTGGSSASLAGVRYTCSCGASRSLATAMNRGALKQIEYNCNASQPWLGIDSEDGRCSRTADELRVVLRGATNVWFADTVSSLYIPISDDTVKRRIIDAVEKYYDILQSQRINGEWNREFMAFIAKDYRIDADDFYEAIVQKHNNIESHAELSEETSEDEYRYAEYKLLNRNSGSDADDFHAISVPIDEYSNEIHAYFESISLIPKLRETRAFVGFSRLEPKKAPISHRKKALSIGRANWLPAIQVYGEGIFFEFNQQLLAEWAAQKCVQERIKKLNSAFKKSVFNDETEGDLRPEFVLIHTFSHLLINQLSFESGYSSSSIRERIYCEATSNNYSMNGVMIYTASGDSDGSLGGLVNLGKPGQIEDTIVSALKTALWCTSDPICSQSAGQGPESCNLAACHNCALLPETSCEKGNRLLDRALLVGTISDPKMGYFNSLTENL